MILIKIIKPKKENALLKKSIPKTKKLKFTLLKLTFHDPSQNSSLKGVPKEKKQREC